MRRMTNLCMKIVGLSPTRRPTRRARNQARRQIARWLINLSIGGWLLG